jgi:predicted tellurium resistance membrane protein TerC
MQALLLDPQNWIAFFTLCALEIVLGVDNIIFISILSEQLPESQRKKSRQTGLILAAFMRLGLLFSITWVMKLSEPLFNVFGTDICGRDLILILGGLILIFNSIKEIRQKISKASKNRAETQSSTFQAVLIKILMVDLVFSLDSIITAVGMSDQVWVMVAAILVSVVLMLFAAGPLNAFVQKYPSIKVLALAFLILIGAALIADGLSLHFSKGYVYVSMAFGCLVEYIHILIANSEPSNTPSKSR